MHKADHITKSIRGTQMFFLLMLLAVGAGITACHTARKVTTGSTPEGDTAEFYTSCYPIGSLTVPSCDFQVSDGNRTLSLNGSIYIRPDSVCYIRARLVVEAVRLAVYRDSFIMVNYLERTCYRGSNPALQRLTGFPADPETLLKLFTADLCEASFRNHRFTVSGGSGNQLVMEDANRNMLEVDINPADNTISSIVMNSSQMLRELFSATYGNFRRFPQFSLPTLLDISVADGASRYSIKANFKQIQLNVAQEVSVTVPGRYRVVRLD